MRKAPKATSLALNLAPMVDVMMCLLIFFMLATKMVEQEKSRVDLPRAASARETEKQAGDGRFVINVKSEAGVPVYLIREEQVPLTDVLTRLGSAAEIDRDLQCVIRADRDIAYRHVEILMKGCAESGVYRVSFGALRSDEGNRS